MSPKFEDRATFTVILPHKEHEELAKLAIERITTMAHLVRTAVIAYLRMEMYGIPTCGNGQTCLCPRRWNPDAPDNGN